MPRRREREDGDADSSASDDDDELEQALAAPRYATRERIVAGHRVTYTRHLLYAPDEDGGIAPALHDKPLRDTRHDNVSLTGLDRGPVPDPYDEAGYADMDEQPEAIGQFKEFVHGPAMAGIMATRQSRTTHAASERMDARAADLALRRQVDEATRRATVGNDALVSLDWARIVPRPLLPAFLREASPVLAVLLPMLARHKADVIHETLASMRDTMQSAAGCTFERVIEHTLRGHIAKHVPAGECYEPFTTAAANEHAHCVGGQTRLCELVFRCHFAGDDADGDDNDDDDDDNGHADANDDQHASVPMPEHATTTTLRVPTASSAATHARAPGGAVPEEKDDVPFRYRVHVVCHDAGRLPIVPGPKAGEKPEAMAVREAHERLLCFRTFYFTRRATQAAPPPSSTTM